ncbi:putative ABC transporter ATP-binding protein [uncultured archaeon]|nr:putative ABC transporter ATP-binding protein [uncultured archaeon]
MALRREMAVVANGIYKSYKSFFGPEVSALRDISLEIVEGEIFGLLGPNGSGMTPLNSIFSTLIYPERGGLFILGLDAHRDRDKIRKLINIATAKSNFPWSLTVQENLRHYGMLYGLYGKDLKRAIGDQIAAFELEEFRDLKFEDLSTALKQRLCLAKSMLNSPRLLLLDEPTTGLDPDISMKTRQLIKRIHEEEGMTVVLCTHYMPEAETLCDRIAFLRKGSIVALDTPQSLKNQLNLGENMVVKYDGMIDIQELKALPGVLAVKPRNGAVEIIFDRSAQNLDGIIKLFSPARIQDIDIKEPDLEDVFLELAR